MGQTSSRPYGLVVASVVELGIATIVAWQTTESVLAAHLAKGDPVKKVAAGLAISLLVLCLLIVIGHRSGTVKSQANSQPATSTPAKSTPTTSTPATSTPAATPATYRNRPVGRWVTTNVVFLTTLINDTNNTVDFLKNENLAYAEEACPQLRCDIATMQGRPPPRDSLASSRALSPAPSGYRCPPIPDPQTAADLNAGMSQLQSAIAHLINGENSFNGDLIRLAESEMQAASATFAKVQTDLGNAQGQL